MNVGWSTGLPIDVLALVARAGGVSEMKRMRSVCKSWQEGFDLGVTGIGICELQHPVLPSGVAAASRFPGLTQLDLGCSAVGKDWLDHLGAFSKLEILTLGGWPDGLGPGGALSVRLKAVDMKRIQVCVMLLLMQPLPTNRLRENCQS